MPFTPTTPLLDSAGRMTLVSPHSRGGWPMRLPGFAPPTPPSTTGEGYSDDKDKVEALAKAMHEASGAHRGWDEVGPTVRSHLRGKAMSILVRLREQGWELTS